VDSSRSPERFLVGPEYHQTPDRILWEDDAGPDFQAFRFTDRFPADIRTAKGRDEELVVGILRERTLACEFVREGESGAEEYPSRGNPQTQHR
jgi:hypothetical protein